jgi:hypothetical protein
MPPRMGSWQPERLRYWAVRAGGVPTRCAKTCTLMSDGLIEGGPMYVSAVDSQDEIRAVEMDGHPFFVATLFQPELAATPSPLVAAFVTACQRRSQTRAQAAG